MIILGYFGIHNFYLGRIAIAVTEFAMGILESVIYFVAELGEHYAEWAIAFLLLAVIPALVLAAFLKFDMYKIPKFLRSKIEDRRSELIKEFGDVKSQLAARQ